MELFTPGHLLPLLIVAAILFFGWKQLPDMARSVGRSLRIFKTEMKGMSEDDQARAATPTAPVSTEPIPPALPSAPPVVVTPPPATPPVVAPPVTAPPIASAPAETPVTPPAAPADAPAPDASAQPGNTGLRAR